MNPILEPIHLEQHQSITGFIYEKTNFEMPWHFHPQHELTYIEESFGTKFIGDYVGAYESGELVLLRSKLPHCWKNEMHQKGSSKSFVIQWNKGIFTHVPELAPVFNMLKTASKGIIFDKEEVAHLIPQFKALITLEGHELYIKLLSLLVSLSECSQKTLSEASFIDDLPSEYGKRISKVHDFVETNYTQKIYLKEVADLVNMSEQSFSRFFSKMMGRSFFTFLNEYRINIATRMLIDSDETVSQIAFACGYESLPFFFKKFGKVHQLSPAKYRKKHVV
ncbi:AraC family transcriptional regulator [Algibacter sp. 2305UL17-15]|uniref:AraC family transcriptional regulator n=1 Tax=Algibacter sp. 2305UL17-15 TaxID=3231268 RepID=UPI0034584FD3